jgi:hypothetical protein
VERKTHFFAMDLSHGDASFVQAYPAETTEAFCAGHVAAFGFFGKVPRSILYDNTTWRWLGSWATGRGSGRGCSASCSHIACSLTASVGPARAPTKARSRVWLG